MSGQELLGNIAFVVSICVVIGMAIMFSILFGIYGYYKIKHIKYGHEDIKLEKNLRTRYKDIIRKRSEEELKVADVDHFVKTNEPDYMLVQDLKSIKTFTLIGNKEVEQPTEPTTVIEAILEEKKKSKKWQRVSNVFFGILYALLIIVFGMALIFNVTGQQVFIGNTALVAIYTGSMETVNDKNTYIQEQGLTDSSNRIIQYSLIGLDKVQGEDEMELYKIYGFKNEEGTLIVHRLIRIYTNEDTGVTYYTFRGDANSDSLSYELVVTFDQIVGTYNGFQSYGLGVAIIYLQSGIGLIAIFAAIIFLASYQTSEHFIEKAYDERVQMIAKQIDAKPLLEEYKKDPKFKKAEERI